MAAGTSVFSDKETNNWLKACLALNITKKGLANFLDRELQTFHSTVGISCGTCSIEKLIPCPTYPYCSKRKGKYCPYHKSQIPHPCLKCDHVKQNITLHHRYKNPSWRNTDAIKWQSDCWEIGKCFLPPDGYSSVSSVQESDFNGVISIMLNCMHFQTNCLSSSCLLPPPPDKQSPLEMVRQIGRDVRHSSDCKVTDADLKGYFQRLSTLLADPKRLLHDHSATIAHKRLNDLQNDQMSLKELGELLKEAYQTLDRAKEALLTLETSIRAGELRIESKTQVGEQRVESKTLAVEKRIEAKGHDVEGKIKDGTQHIERHVQDGIVRVQQAANKTQSEDYERGVADLRELLMQYYDETTCNVPLSTFDHSLDKQITDIYTTPKIYRIKIEKDGKRVKTGEQVLTYKELFFTDDKSNQRIFIQGEPGRGKSTFAVKLVHDWCNKNQPLSAAPSENISCDNRRIWGNKDLLSSSAFEDRLTIQKFKFLFFITLRDSRDQTDLTQMIKKQLIDNMFFEDERADVYKLLVQILKTEICLVVREGLDEWVSHSDSNLAEPSMAGFPKKTCTVLTTSRPWKLADERIKNLQIDSLFEIEGVSSPYAFSKNILGCILDQPNDLKDIVDQFKLFVILRKLTTLSSSPMLFAVVICTWADKIEDKEHLNGSSLCALYTTLLESLCKKSSSATGYFNDSNPPPVSCFSNTSYLLPNIEHLDKLAEAACKLLFSSARESSIVFDDKTLSNYFSNEEFTVRKMFALNAGILSNRKDKSQTGSANSFIHKTVQEFLAALHIACNPNVIDDVISRYVQCNNNAYLEISQVFIFLCGMNISAANKLSALMNQCDITHCRPYLYMGLPCDYQLIIESGIKEAVANKQDGIGLKLSHFYINENITDIYLIWSTNTSNVQELSIEISEQFVKNMSSSLERDEPPSHYEFNLSLCHRLKSLKLKGNYIGLTDTASPVTSEHPVWITLNSAYPAQCADPPPVLPSIEKIKLHDVLCPSTWLRSLFSTLLALDHEVQCDLNYCKIRSCAEGAVSGSSTSVKVTIQTSKHTLSMRKMYKNSDNPGLWEALNGLNIKSLTLSGLNTYEVKSLSQSLSSLTQLESLSMEVHDCPGMWGALTGLNIKSLSLSGCDGCEVKSLSQSLSSLTQLESLSMEVYACPGLWEALTGLNIKSLTLNIKSLSLSGWNDCSNDCWNDILKVKDEESLSQSLVSLKQLETLTIYLRSYIDIQLPESLKYLNIYLDALLPFELIKLVDTLSACINKVGSKLEFSCSYLQFGRLKRFPVDEYMTVLQELETLKNVKVKLFRIFDRIRPNMRTGDADSAWSLRGSGNIDGDSEDGEDLKDDLYRDFIKCMDDNIINRISMRFLIIPASIS